MYKKGQKACILNTSPCIIGMKKVVARSTTTKNNITTLQKGTLEREQRRKDCEIRQSTGTRERSEQRGIRSSALNEWGFSNKMIDLTRHIDKVRKA